MKRIILFALAYACGGRPAERGLPMSITAVTVSVGAKPVEVAAGDLDGDGALDLVSANAGDSNLSVRLRRGDTWVAAAGDTLALPVQPHLLALADVDGDRDLDILATAHDGGGVWVWLGDGEGGFAAAAGSPFIGFASGKPHNHGLAAGDLDGDGDVDVALADQDARAVAVLLGDGRGRFAPAPASPVALGGEPYVFAAGDLDRDGDLDLVFPLLERHAVEVLLGDGQGRFTRAPGSPHPTRRDRPYATAVGDLDGDGALDVVAPHDDTDAVSVLLGDGKGGLRDAPGSPIALGRRIWRPAIADLDGDGAADLVGAGSGALVVALGDGKGGCGRPRELATGGWNVAAGDLDGDGRPDLVNPDNDANVLRVWAGIDWRGPR